MFPGNEVETIALFQVMEEHLGWQIVHLQTRFPDAVIENCNGQRLVAEFEHLARNFQVHGHDPSGCDLIICWGNDWIEAPLPVWAIEDTMIANDRSLNRWRARARYFKSRCRQLLGLVYEAEEKIDRLNHRERIYLGALEYLEKHQLPWQGRNRLGDIIWYADNWRDRSRMQMFFDHALSFEEVRAYLGMIMCGGGDAPSGVETRKTIEGKANDFDWDWLDGWNADRFTLSERISGSLDRTPNNKMDWEVYDETKG